jgi:hypothetical protein
MQDHLFRIKLGYCSYWSNINTSHEAASSDKLIKQKWWSIRLREGNQPLKRKSERIDVSYMNTPWPCMIRIRHLYKNSKMCKVNSSRQPYSNFCKKCKRTTNITFEIYRFNSIKNKCIKMISRFLKTSHQH